MSRFSIVEFLELKSTKPNLLDELKEIFLLTTTVKTLDTPDAEDQFYQKWTHHYLSDHPNYIFCAIDNESKRLLGYIMGTPNSLASAEKLIDKHPYLQTFKNLYSNFPAHFHIDCHPDSQGKGIGTKLIERFLKKCHDENLSGAHIITSQDAENLSFYKKMGFNIEHKAHWKDHKLLFMGRDLSIKK